MPQNLNQDFKPKPPDVPKLIAWIKEEDRILILATPHFSHLHSVNFVLCVHTTQLHDIIKTVSMPTVIHVITHLLHQSASKTSMMLFHIKKLLKSTQPIQISKPLHTPTHTYPHFRIMHSPFLHYNTKLVMFYTLIPFVHSRAPKSEGSDRTSGSKYMYISFC